MAPSSKRRKLSDGSPAAIAAAAASASAENSATLPTSPSTAAASKPSKTSGEKDKDNRRSLFVRSLPAAVTSESLAAHFSESFPLKHATVVLDPATKISRGFGFVTFTDASDAQAAAAQFDNSLLEGRKIKVEVAQARHREREDGVPVGAGGKAGVKKGMAAGVNTTGERLRKEREDQKKEAQPPRLIVRNLPWSVKTGGDLSKLFLSYGKVKTAVVPKKGPKAQYGFGIVILRGKKNAEKALEGLNGKEVDGRVLAVDWAVDRETWEKVKEGQAAEMDVDAAEEPATNGDGVTSGMTENDKTTTADADNVDESSEDDADAGVSLWPADGVDVEDDTVDDPAADAEEDEAEDQDLDHDLDAAPSADPPRPDTSNSTIFIRNLPYDTDDEALREHFNSFGPTRYARIVMDHETERSKGTGFVCFVEEDDAKSCVSGAPKKPVSPLDDPTQKHRRKGEQLTHSVLQNDAEDPSGRYTLDGRVLQVTRALPKPDADRRAADSAHAREKAREADKRRLYLLGEGTVPKGGKLWSSLSKVEVDMREASARQRQKMIRANPNLGLSLTRLSVRNLPRWVDAKALKQLAREAVVGFATDVKEGKRAALSPEELKRGGEEMKEAEKRRRAKGVGVVKQAKIVFEDRDGGKVKDGMGGRSRGYGFLEYWSHRSALGGLRWMNGHTLRPKEGATEGDRARRLIVEFAIENAQVVQRRTDREGKAKRKREEDDDEAHGYGAHKGKPWKRGDDQGKQSKPWKRGDDRAKAAPPPPVQEEQQADAGEKNKLAKRNRIISKKRHARKARKG